MAILDPVFANKQGQTPQDIERRRRMAQQLLAQSQENERITSPWQGAAKVAQALMGGYEEARANRDDKTNRAAANDLLAKTLLGGDPYSPASSGASGSPVPMTGAAAEVQQPGSAPSGNPDIAATEAYIREAATKRGIDPETAVKVARSEGLAPGVWQSNVVRKDGGRETSYGPYQLLVGGGLGDKFQKVYGKSPSDPSTLNQQIDFALDEAAQGGWSPWYGAAKVGVGSRTGLQNARALGYQQPQQVASLDPSAGMGTASPIQPPPVNSAAPAPTPGYVDPRLTTEGRAPMQGPTQPAPALPPPSIVASAPPVASAPQQQPASLMSSAVPGQAPSAPSLPQMVAQTSPSKRAQISALLQNPYTQEAGQQMLMQEYERQQQAQNLILKQQLEQNDPKYRQDLEKGGIELENLRNPRLGPADEANIDLNRDKFEFEQENSRLTPDIKEYNFYAQAEKEAGRAPLSPLDWDIARRKSAASSTNVNVGETDKFYENLDKKNAETFATLSDGGIQARTKLGMIDRLEGLMANAPQGGIGALKQTAGEWGVPTEGLSDIQAASALLEKMVPEQRQPGSGPMSDMDIKMFRASLPRIINQPGGNQLIFQTLRGITQYEMQMGEIADRVANREVSPAEGRRQIQELKNPLADFKPTDGPTPNEGWQELSPGVRVRKVK